jgi:hypothetical protein
MVQPESEKRPSVSSVQQTNNTVLVVAKVVYLVDELVVPGTERVEGSFSVDVVDKHAAICSPVEGHAETLEPLLACRIPYLRQSNKWPGMMLTITSSLVLAV